MYVILVKKIYKHFKGILFWFQEAFKASNSYFKKTPVETEYSKQSNLFGNSSSAGFCHIMKLYQVRQE